MIAFGSGGIFISLPFSNFYVEVVHGLWNTPSGVVPPINFLAFRCPSIDFYLAWTPKDRCQWPVIPGVLLVS